ncbi:DNA-processing protein DprA [Corallococcus exiguus]|uniref:DNA-processing protein DprA n=1 Tax=Corallococcus exiguus TaxID=83462 RepID=UPI0015619965|nr:DNA-processing protein DprA [Corallococcus exiguus]NRD64765.1 DNA-processing protein DprA [Corallococcus exiguus]
MTTAHRRSSLQAAAAAATAPKSASRSLGSRTGPGYEPPEHRYTTTLRDLLEGVRPLPTPGDSRTSERPLSPETELYYSGDLGLVRRPCVAIVGTRAVTHEGAARARRLARELVKAGVVVVSGLAKGVDTEALTAAIEAGGQVVAVIGTPLDQAYPAENKRLQEAIYREHLLVSQFAWGSRTHQGNFPARNRTMAAISDATVIIEAGETSGTLHQAVACNRIGRWLFIARSVVENPNLTWPASFLGQPRTRVLADTEDVIGALREAGAWG